MRAAGRAVYELIKRGVKPRDIMTKEAFENAITVVMAIGGSTNAVLHLLAIASAAGVGLALEDFNRISDRTPLLCDMKPGGKYLTVNLHKANGIPAVMKELLDAGLIHGECMTVTGKTVAENLAGVKKAKSITPVIHDFDAPVMKKWPACSDARQSRTGRQCGENKRHQEADAPRSGQSVRRGGGSIRGTQSK